MAIELTDREMDVLSNLLENIISKLELNDDGEWHPREMVYFCMGNKRKEALDSLAKKIISEQHNPFRAK